MHAFLGAQPSAQHHYIRCTWTQLSIKKISFGYGIVFWVFMNYFRPSPPSSIVYFRGEQGQTSVQIEFYPAHKSRSSRIIAEGPDTEFLAIPHKRRKTESRPAFENEGTHAGKYKGVGGRSVIVLICKRISNGIGTLNNHEVDKLHISGNTQKCPTPPQKIQEKENKFCVPKRFPRAKILERLYQT